MKLPFTTLHYGCFEYELLENEDFECFEKLKIMVFDNAKIWPNY